MLACHMALNVASHFPHNTQAPIIKKNNLEQVDFLSCPRVLWRIILLATRVNNALLLKLGHTSSRQRSNAKRQQELLMCCSAR